MRARFHRGHLKSVLVDRAIERFEHQRAVGCRPLAALHLLVQLAHHAGQLRIHGCGELLLVGGRQERRAFRGGGADAGGIVEGNADAGNGAVVVNLEKPVVERFEFGQIDAHGAASSYERTKRSVLHRKTRVKMLPLIAGGAQPNLPDTVSI
ncbi:hypothetical protein ES703_125578 [subsurface metagenome]